MGTRGAYGFVIDGEEKITYNHFDSYTSGLGADILKALREHSVEQLREEARKIVLVDEQDEPSAADLERFAEFHDAGVSTGNDWYALLRDAQGDIDAHLKASVMIDSHGFVSDSLFCEYAYIIDLDAETFEAYRGFQEEPHTEGRFHDRVAVREGDRQQWFPVRLLGTWPLDQLPTEDQLSAAVEPQEDD